MGTEKKAKTLITLPPRPTPRELGETRPVPQPTVRAGMEPTTPPAGIRTGLKREHTTADPALQGRQKRHRPDGQAPDSFPFQQQQESRPYSIIPQQQEPYVPGRGDESRWLETPGRAHDNTRGIPVNHLGLGNLQGVGTSDQSANYYPPHLSLHQHARHGRPDAAPAGIHSGTDTPHREIPLAQGLSQDTLPPFVSRVARERGVGGYTAGGVPGGQQPVEGRRGSPEEPRASPDDCSSPEDSSALVVPCRTGTNSVRLGLVSNFQTENRGAPSFDTSSEESFESESSKSEDDAEGGSDELEDYQDDRSHLSQGEDADIELEDAEDAEEESSNEDEDLDQPGFDNRVVLRRATTYRALQSRNDRTVDSVARTLQASRLDDSDSDTDTSSSDSSSSSSDEDQRCSPDQGYDTQDELAEEIHRAEFAYDDDDDKVDLIRRKYGPPMDSRDTPAPNEDTNKGRRTLRPQEREDVKNTRHMGACVRCRLQKIKCNTDRDKPNGECISCKVVNQESPKIHRFMACQRLKIADLVLYRCGGLNLTRRWKGIQMRDVSDRVDNIPTVIHVSQGLCRKPLLMQVVRFKPRPGDVTARYWTDTLSGKETFKKKELASYCLYNIMTAAEAVEKYTVENAVPAFIDTLKDEMSKGKKGEGCIHRTELMALKRYMYLTEKANKSEDDIREIGIMINLFTLWCAIRHTTGSFYIEGEEKLGMLPETEDRSYPLLGKVSVPRMIVAQFDTLNYVWVLERYKNKLLRDVDWLLLQNKSRWWLTLYIIVFILLREASWVSLDRYRHARENFASTLRYSIPFFVESLHESCNNILVHWHYRNKEKWPESLDPKAKEGTFLSDLTDEQYILIQQTRRDPEVHRQLRVWEIFKKENGRIIKIERPQNPNGPQYTGKQNKFDWDHPFYWVAQIFEPDWFPHPTYQREPIPKSAAG